MEQYGHDLTLPRTFPLVVVLTGMPIHFVKFTIEVLPHRFPTGGQVIAASPSSYTSTIHSGYVELPGDGETSISRSIPKISLFTGLAFLACRFPSLHRMP